MKKIELKTVPSHFGYVEDGIKTFELRKDDRDFEVGDVLVLRQYLPYNNGYTGEFVERNYTYIERCARIWINARILYFIIKPLYLAMKHLFAPVRIASMVKEIGFNEQCIAEYVKGGIFKIHEQNHADSGYEEDYFTTYTNQSSNFYLPNFTAAAPTYDQVLEWFRDVHKIHINVNYSKIAKEYFYCVDQIDEPFASTGPLTTYRNALNEGIIHAYKIVKNKP